MIMNKNTAQKTVWVITEGLIGTQNQCIGVADALGFPYKVFQVGLRQPWRSLSPWLKFENELSFKGFPAPPWPDILITAGRKAIAASRYVKRLSPRTFTVHLQDPRIAAHHFNLVAVPQHDRLRGENVVVTLANPNTITPAVLAAARADFAGIFGGFPPPRLGILIGGATKKSTPSAEHMDMLLKTLRHLKATHSLMITTSRRTGAELTEKIELALASGPASSHPIFFYNAHRGIGSLNGQEITGGNPYLGILAWADRMIATNDSTSMLSEAATAGVLSYVIPLVKSPPRQAQLIKNLADYGALRELGELESLDSIDFWEFPPLQDAAKVAAAILSRLST